MVLRKKKAFNSRILHKTPSLFELVQVLKSEKNTIVIKILQSLYNNNFFQNSIPDRLVVLQYWGGDRTRPIEKS
jgi:hypothetical protein